MTPASALSRWFQPPATCLRDQCADGGLQADIRAGRRGIQSAPSARRADETFETGIRLVFVLVAENHQSRLPRRGKRQPPASKRPRRGGSRPR